MVRSRSLLIAVLVLLMPLAVWAKKPKNAPPPPPAPAATEPAPSQLSQDIAAQTEAKTELDQANKALTDLVAPLRPAFEQTPEWTKAQQDLQQAQADLATAKDAITNNLASNPDYQAALAQKTKAQEDLKTARDNGDTTPETLTPLANSILDANTKINKITKEAAESDTSVRDAQTKVIAAQQVVDQLNTKFLNSLADNHDYTTAKAAVDAATKKFQDAHAKVLADGGK